MTTDFRLDADQDLMVTILVNLSYTKKSRVSLYTWKRALVYINTRLHFESTWVRHVLCKKRLVPKIAIGNTVQFRFFNVFEWSNSGLVNNPSPYHHTTASLLPSFRHRHIWIRQNPYFSPSIRLIKCQLRFVYENYFKKVNFYVILGPILTLWNIF